jgi:hypothetical protein
MQPLVAFLKTGWLSFPATSQYLESGEKWLQMGCRESTEQNLIQTYQGKGPSELPRIALIEVLTATVLAFGGEFSWTLSQLMTFS